MGTYGSKGVEEFLDELSVISPEKHEVVMELLQSIRRMEPHIQESLKYGGIIFSRDNEIGGIFVYSKHVTLEFGEGYLFEDPGNQLLGKGKYRRHLKFRSLSDLRESPVEFFLNQMVERR